MSIPEQPKYILSTARRGGKVMHPHKRKAYAEAMQHYAIDVPNAPTHPSAFFDQTYTQHALEIGYGRGEHVVHLAQSRPDWGIIGSEVYHHGVSKCVRALERHQLKNVRLLVEDGRLLLDQLEDASLDAVYLLFPDPWPKIRHHKRRIVNQAFLTNMARVLKPGGRLRLMTDHADYAQWMWAQVSHTGHLFEWQAKDAAAWHILPKDHMPTRYQAKAAAEGREAICIELVRKQA